MTQVPSYELPDACRDKPSMSDWLNEEGVENDAACRPCVLPVAAAWYVEEMRELGLEQNADELETFMNAPDITPLQLAEKLDTIKSAVDPGLANRLREFDCTVQVNVDDLQEVEEHG